MRGAVAVTQGQVVGQPFIDDDKVGVIPGERRCARQDGDLGERRQLVLDAGHPQHRRPAVDDLRASQQAAAELGLVVDEDDPSARAGRAPGRRETGRSATDDEHVAVDVPMLGAFPVAGGHRTLAGETACLEPGEQFDRLWRAPAPAMTRGRPRRARSALLRRRRACPAVDPGGRSARRPARRRPAAPMPACRRRGP